MLKKTVTLAALSDDADGIVELVTLSGGGLQSYILDGALVTGGIATLGAGQIAVCTCTGDETARTFTVSGTDVDAVVISEELTGVNATTVKTTINFKTITGITSDANTVNTVSFGTLAADLGYSATIDVHHRRGQAVDDTIWLDIAGTMAVTVEITDDRNSGIFADSRAISGYWVDHASFTAISADKVAKNILGCFGYRLIYTAFTSGSVELAVLTTTD